MDSFFKHLRYGIRNLVNELIFAIVAVSTLALAIEGNTAIFTVVNAVLLPLPNPVSNLIVALEGMNPSRGITQSNMSTPNFADSRNQNQVFEQMAAFTTRVVLNNGEESDRVRGGLGSLMQSPGPDASPVAVIGFRWSKTHQTTSPGPDNPLPAQAVNKNDKNFSRNAQINDPAGVRDPNADTLDNRQAELEKNVRSAEKPAAKTVNAFGYQAKIRNETKQTIEVIFWEYQFIDPANPPHATRRQFMCGVNVKPDKEKELLGSSVSGPPNVGDVAGVVTAKPFQEKVIINRIEFTDGKSWMRKDWNANEIKAGYQRAMATPWSPNEMCRAL